MPVRNVITMDNIEDKLVLCKAITSVKQYVGDRAINKAIVLYILIKTVKLKKATPGRIREYEAVPITSEQAARMFSIMVSSGYLEFAFPYKPRPGETARLPIGERMYRIGQLRLAECMETSWYKNRQRKEKFVKKEERIDKRSCRALQQIYTMFGNVPFTYNMITHTARMITQLPEDKSFEMTKAEMVALKAMRTKLYSYDPGSFREVWQSMLRNGYIIPHKIKTSDGWIKNTGLYKINQPYLKHCLAEMI
jgi:hypothetical protein